MEDTFKLKGRGDFKKAVYRLRPGESEEDVLRGMRDGTREPDEVVEEKDANVWLTVLKTELLKLATGVSTNHFDSGNTRIGVGTNATAAAASDTDLLSTVPNACYKGMESGYPTTPSSGSFKVKSVFNTSEANFAWNELVVKNAASGICWNRNTTGWSTKGSSEVWTMEVTLTLS